MSYLPANKNISNIRPSFFFRLAMKKTSSATASL